MRLIENLQHIVYIKKIVFLFTNQVYLINSYLMKFLLLNFDSYIAKNIYNTLNLIILTTQYKYYVLHRLIFFNKS